MSSLRSSRSQHPGRQLRGALISRPNNVSSGMLFWPKSFLHACGLNLLQHWGQTFAMSTYALFANTNSTNVGPMWTQCGFNVDSVWTSLLIRIKQCGPNVDTMWTRCGLCLPIQIQQMCTQCGPDVDSMWTRRGLPLPIPVQQMWTQTPFSIYNNIGGGGRSPHGHHRNVVLGARGSKWGRWRAGCGPSCRPSGPLGANIPEDNYVGH